MASQHTTSSRVRPPRTRVSPAGRAITACTVPAQPPAHWPAGSRIRHLYRRRNIAGLERKVATTFVTPAYLPSRACRTWRARRPWEIDLWPIRLIGGLSGCISRSSRLLVSRRQMHYAPAATSSLAQAQLQMENCRPACLAAGPLSAG
jgi:hypothetical protein